MSEDVDVWLIALDADALPDSPLAQTLSADEQARAARMRPGPAQHGFVTARAALRQILAGYLGIAPARVPLALREGGKPILDATTTMSAVDELHFSVTHTQGIALCAVARGRELGVDAEWRDPTTPWQAIAATVFSASEQAEMQRLPEQERHRAFFAGWTRKEALLKGLGTGFSRSAKQIDVPMGPQLAVPQRFPSADTGPWTLMDLNIGPEYAAALAVQGEVPSLRLSAWPKPPGA